MQKIKAINVVVFVLKKKVLIDLKQNEGNKSSPVLLQGRQRRMHFFVYIFILVYTEEKMLCQY